MSLISPFFRGSIIPPSPFSSRRNRLGQGESLAPAVFIITIITICSRLKEYKDTVRLVIFTLDIITQNYPIITSVEGLPHDCLSLLPCATSLGGAVIVTTNSMIYVDQSSRRVVLPLNGWPARISDLPMLALPPGDQSRNLELEGSRSVFIDDRTIFLTLKDGTVYPVEIIVDGKTVSKLTIGPALAQTTIPSVVRKTDKEHFFVGSTVGPSVLLKAAHVEEEISEDQVMADAPTAVVQFDNGMDLDDDDDGQYFNSVSWPKVTKSD